MAKRNTYTTFYSSHVSEMLSEYPGSKRKEVCFCGLVGAAVRCLEGEKGNHIGSLYEFGFYYAWKFSKITHYFLAPGLADFCIDSVKALTSDFHKALPVAQNEPTEVTGVLALDEILNHAFCLHFPTRENRRSIMVLPFENIAGRQAPYFFVACASDRDFVFAPSDIDECSDSDGHDRLIKLIFGFSLYIDAFPDTVVSGHSEDIKHINYYNGDRTVINRNEIVENEARCGVSPHWRRGHFRLLTSERYKNKRWQTVYVKGAFIKGKALDVLDDC